MGGLRATRLSVLLNSALGVVARQASSSLVDLDSLPEEAVGVGEALRFLLSASAASLRKLLKEEAVGAVDVMTRQFGRKAFAQALASLPSRPSVTLPFLGRLSLPLPLSLPDPQTMRGPFLVPRTRLGEAATPVVAEVVPVWTTPRQVVDQLFPRLTREEELYAIALGDLCAQTLGKDAASVLRGDVLLEPDALSRLLVRVSQSLSSQSLGGSDSNPFLRQLQPLIGRLDPELGWRENLRTLLVGRSAAVAGTSAEQGLDEVMTAFQGLTVEESAVLRRSVEDVLAQVASKGLDRLQTLIA